MKVARRLIWWAGASRPPGLKRDDVVPPSARPPHIISAQTTPTQPAARALTPSTERLIHFSSRSGSLVPHKDSTSAQLAV